MPTKTKKLTSVVFVRVENGLLRDLDEEVARERKRRRGAVTTRSDIVRRFLLEGLERVKERS